MVARAHFVLAVLALAALPQLGAQIAADTSNARFRALALLSPGRGVRRPDPRRADVGARVGAVRRRIGCNAAGAFFAGFAVGGLAGAGVGALIGTAATSWPRVYP